MAHTRAVILARGLGTRMRRADPGPALAPAQRAAAEAGMKGMVPVGRPFLDYLLAALADAGCQEVCAVIGPDHGAVRDRYEREAVPVRVRVSFAVQPEPRGTADAVLSAETFASGGSFLVMNADDLYPVSALKALRALEGCGMAGFERASLLATSNLGPERLASFPVARAAEDGRLETLVDGGRADHDLVSMNLWAFTAAIFAACRDVAPAPNGERELPDAVRLAVTRGVPFTVVPCPGPVLDLTSRGDIAFVTERLRGVEVAL